MRPLSHCCDQVQSSAKEIQLSEVGINDGQEKQPPDKDSGFFLLQILQFSAALAVRLVGVGGSQRADVEY